MASTAYVSSDDTYLLLDEDVASGALSVTRKSSYLNIFSITTYTLPNGISKSQVKTIICNSAAADPEGTVTPISPLGFSAILFLLAGQSVELQWTGSAWVILNVNGATVIP